MAYLKTHYYGGIKKYQWTAIPLAMHGVVVKSDGTVIKVCIGEEAGDPQFTITDILPHLGQDQATKPLVLPLQAKTLTSSSAAARFATRRLRMHIS